MADKPTLRLLLAALPGLAGCNTISGADGIALPGAGGEGPAPPPPMAAVDGVSIDQIAIYQGVKLQLMQAGAPVAATFSVVAGRDAMMRIFYTADPSYNGQPVTARLTLGTEVPIDVTAALGGTSAEQTLQSTIDIDVPGSMMTAPLDYRVDLLQDPSIATGTNAAALYPGGADRDPLPIDSSGPQLKIVFIPIAYGGDGSDRLPDTSDAQLQLYQEWFSGIYPTPRVDISVGPQMGWHATVDASGHGWDDLLNAITDFRAQQHAAQDEYYFGLFEPAADIYAFCGGGCVARLSWQTGPSDSGNRAGIGLGFSGDDSPQTAVHEVGHLHGLPHAPCPTTIQGVDPDYPYPNASIGVWGYSVPRKQLFSPLTIADMMSYCPPIWISDYNYIKLFQRIQWVNGVAADVLPPQGASPGTYERVAIDIDGKARWIEPIVLDTPPVGEPLLAKVQIAGKVVSVEGSWHRYSELPGGVLMFAQPSPLPTKVELSVDGHWHSATRDQLTHLALTNRRPR